MKIARTLFEYIIGIPTCTLLFALLMVVNLLQMSSLVLLPLSRNLFRKFNRNCAAFWWGTCVFWAEKIYGIRVNLSGDIPPELENVLVIANHQCMSDIVAIMTLAVRKGRLGDLKWFVKDVIKYAPGVGWGMLFLDCLFIKRNWAQDQSRINATFKKLLNHRIPFWLISFSEGTRFTPKKLAISREFARKEGRKEPTNVLIPRTRGFVASVQGLRPVLDAIYDLTISYPVPAPSLFDLTQAKCMDLNIHIKRYTLQELPLDDRGLSEWLLRRFEEKDLYLSKFQAHLKLAKNQ